MRSRIPFLACVALGILCAGALLADDWKSKVDPWVMDSAARGETEFLVFLREQADLRGAATLTTRSEKGAFVRDALESTAQRTQAPLRRLLASRGVAHRAFWVANMIWVRGSASLVSELAARDDVHHVYANPTVHFEGPVDRAPSDAGASPQGIEWNITQVHAPDVWALGFTGQGIVVGGQDTGYQWDHPAIQGKYRGWDGAIANHNYNWHDSIHSGGGVCGPDALAPCDDTNHGTHTMGTMVGDDGGSNQIGMAPGAKWIGCRNMDQGNGTPATYSECFEWFIAPTDLAGLNPDPSKAPHVINNSWSCPPSEGCTDPDALKTVVENTRAAGIEVVVSAGNSGSSCGSVDSPAAIYDASFSVGATDINDIIASFSSRGAVTVDGSFRLKPDVSAPGVSVRSCVPTNSYAVFGGTSMAGPHVAGLVALLLSAQPGLAGDPDSIEPVITSTAVPRTSTQTCNGVPGSSIPNNTYGWGRVDALAAVNCPPAAPVITAPVSVPSETSGLTASANIAAGHSATWALTGGTITAGQGTNQVTFDSGVAGTTMVLSVVDSVLGCDSPESSKSISVDFLDVPPEHDFHDFINTIARNGITAGCGDGTNFCPDASVTRGEMAVFLLKALLGADYLPPLATGIFDDVPVDYFARDWVEDLYNRQITAGCNPNPPPLQYCPDRPVTRGEMAVFLLKTLLGVGYVPPTAAGIFEDVPLDYFAIDWIEDLYARAITVGCSADPLLYCPEAPNTRGQMAVFLTLTFGLQ